MISIHQTHLVAGNLHRMYFYFTSKQQGKERVKQISMEKGKPTVDTEEPRVYTNRVTKQKPSASHLAAKLDRVE
ncbi:MAG TPA: hypothetical protein DHV71_04695 [Acidaminococcaceae bacterium]|nr:hypothetical protein [Acidaminococcaceae bacterium]